MNLRIIFFCLLVLIIMGGCYPVERSSNVITSEQRNVNLSSNKESNTSDVQQEDKTKYDGKWISTDYQIVKMDGYTARFGSELYIKSKIDGIIEMNMHDISAPPANRIASIETDVKISTEGTGKFTFNNDGWGSHGSGTIELHENKVIINIDSQIEEGNNPDWRIYSGQRVFIREKIH